MANKKTFNNTMKKYIYTFMMLGTALFISSCSGGSSEDKQTDAANTSNETTEEVSDDPLADKGIGPIEHVEIGDLDEALAKEGEALFVAKCSACHKIDKRFVGPALQGVLERRSPEWVMNMILNPEQMVAENPIAMELLAEYLSPMANQNLTQEEARAILEYFRTN